jgi:hypothetical protein
MRPKQFVLLAIAAIVSSLLALASWTLGNQWSEGRLAGSRLLPSFEADAGKVAALEIKQGASTLTLEKQGNAWGIKERAGYPAEIDKVRSLMVRLSRADLLETKTRKADRYALIELEDPAGKDAKSRGIRAIDAKGGVLADIVVGKRRADAFGAGKGATYVRKPSDPQAWLASGEIDASVVASDWMKLQVLETDSAKISKLSIEIDGEEPLKVERGSDSKVAFIDFPAEGKKLKDAYAADSLLRTVGSIDMEDVRKRAAAPSPKDVSKVSFETLDGLKITHAIRKEEGSAYWLSMSVSGTGDVKKVADDLAAKVGGWEFKIAPGKAESLLKKRAELLDDKAS